MLARNMRYAPDRNDIGKIATVLVSDLIAVKITDSEKVSEALDTIGRTHEDWPSTATIINTIKPKFDGTTYLGQTVREYKNSKPNTLEAKNIHDILQEAKRRIGVTDKDKLTPEKEESLILEAAEKFKAINDANETEQTAKQIADMYGLDKI